MITSSKEVDSQREKEGDTASDEKIIKASSSSSTTPWLRLKDPRIVRVSRAFGGKDRHSKVYTIRGLRDRRVRLSVPTAIQLYDLQDRLGLNQPSKVVDWLLNAAKHEIDELPPLSMPPMNFSLNHEIGASQSNRLEGFKLNSSSINWEDNNQGVLLTRPNFWNSDSFLKGKSKEIARDSVNEKESWTKTNEEEENKQEESNAVPSSSTLFPRPTHSLFSSLAAGGGSMNNAIPYGSFFQLEHPNFPLSHLGNYHGFAAQTTDQHHHHHHHDLHNLNAMPLPSTLSLSSGSQILVSPPGTAQPYFPSHEIDPRSQTNHFQMLASSTQNLFPNSLTTSATPYSMNQSARPFHFSVTPRLVHNSHNSGSHDQQPDNKDQ